MARHYLVDTGIQLNRLRLWLGDKIVYQALPQLTWDVSFLCSYCETTFPGVKVSGVVNLLVIGNKLTSSFSLALTITYHKMQTMCVKSILKEPVSLSLGQKINRDFYHFLPKLFSFLPTSGRTYFLVFPPPIQMIWISIKCPNLLNVVLNVWNMLWSPRCRILMSSLPHIWLLALYSSIFCLKGCCL